LRFFAIFAGLSERQRTGGSKNKERTAKAAKIAKKSMFYWPGGPKKQVFASSLASFALLSERQRAGG
jgi:hypothetical protein